MVLDSRPSPVSEISSTLDTGNRSISSRRDALEKMRSSGDTMTMPGTNDVLKMAELLVSSLVQTDALAKLLIEKGIITQQEFMAKIAAERATYQRMLDSTPH